MGLYRAQVTEGEFVQEMQNAYPNEYSTQGLKCLYANLIDDDTDTIFKTDEIHREFTEYKGLNDYNQRTSSSAESISDIWGVLEFPSLDGFIVN